MIVGTIIGKVFKLFRPQMLAMLLPTQQNKQLLFISKIYLFLTLTLTPEFLFPEAYINANIAKK